MDFDWVPLEVWETIFNYLSDQEIIAVNGLSKDSRIFFDNAVFYTQRFRERWLMLNSEPIDIFEFDMECITRDTYVGVCKQFFEWKKDSGLLRDDIFNVKIDLLQKWHTSRYRDNDSWCITYSTPIPKGCFGWEKTPYTLGTVPKKWFDELYEDYIKTQQTVHFFPPFQYLFVDNRLRRPNHIDLIAHHRAFIFNEPVRDIRINNAVIRALTGDDRRNHRAAIQGQAQRRVLRVGSHREIIGLRAYRDCPRFNKYPRGIFPSIFERRLARRYLRMRYLERHGKLVIYNRYNHNNLK